MRCTTTTKQLISYIDSVADPTVREHINGCVDCQRRARELTRSQQRFAAKLTGDDCPNTMNLGEYHLRIMDSADHEALRKHVQGCASCLSRLNQLAMQMDPSALVKRRSADRGRERTTGTTPFSSAIFYPVIRQTQMAQGLRGAATRSESSPAQSTLLDYTIDLGKISIRLARSAANSNLVDITGLMLGVQAPFSKVNLLVADSEHEIAFVPVNQLGGFSIEGVLSGEYDLELVVESDFSILLREFNI